VQATDSGGQTENLSHQLLSEKVEPHVRLMEGVHFNLPDMGALPPNADYGVISPIISAGCATFQIASLIMYMLLSYLRSRNAQLTALRATSVSTFLGDDKSWPVVEWMEDDTSRGLAIFGFDDDEEPDECSWLMHSGVRSEAGWEKSRVVWNVSSVDSLKALFLVSQHIYEILRWPPIDVLHLCYGYKAEEMTEE
jgi:hypothetical protein